MASTAPGTPRWLSASRQAHRAWRESKPLWPTLVWLTILLAIGVVLYLLAPPLAFLYAIVVGVIARFSAVASWLERE